MLSARLNHVAYLVSSVTQSAQRWSEAGSFVGSAERWEGEGTLEIYVGNPELSGRLLLMEPVAPGAYRRAIEERGPGLHHLAVDVLDVKEYVLALGGSGWLLHPMSLRTLEKTRTAYLARPGIPFLVEVQEREVLSTRALFTTRIEVPVAPSLFPIVVRLGISEIAIASEMKTVLVCDGKRIPEEIFLN